MNVFVESALRIHLEEIVDIFNEDCPEYMYMLDMEARKVLAMLS